MPLPLIISFDGNIGSGKSTTCEEYEQYLKNEINMSLGSEKAPLFPKITSFEEEVCFLDEPVALWNQVCDENGVNILTNLYKNIRSNAFKFQMMAYISRLVYIKKAVEENPDAVIITERSLITDKEVFAKMLFDDKKIEDVNYQIYLKIFQIYLLLVHYLSIWSFN